MDNNGNNESTGAVVIKGVAVSGAGNIVLRFLDVVIAVLLLRWLSILDYGAYRLSLAAFEFFAAFFLAGLENVVVSDVSKLLKDRPRAAKSVFSFYFYFMFFLGVAMWALFFWGGEILSRWASGGGNYIRIVSFLFLLTPFETAYKLRFQIFLDFKWNVLHKVFFDLIRLGVMAFLFFFSLFRVTEALNSLIFATALPLLIIAVFYRREPLIIIPSLSEVKEAAGDLFFRHGKWALASDYINNASQNIRPFVIKLFVGTEAVAIVSVAQNLIANIKSIFPLRDILNPVLPRSVDDNGRLSEQINRATKYSTIAYVAIGVVSAVFVPVMIAALFPKYWVALPYFYVMLLGLPTSGFRSVALPVFYALKAQRTLFILTITRLSFLVVLSVALTYFFGIWGAVVEIFLGGIIVVPAYAAGIKNLIPQWKFSWRNMFIFDDYDRIVLATIKGVIFRRLKIFGL